VGEATWRRGRGRHTGLVGAAPGGLDPVDRVFGAWPTPPPAPPPPPAYQTGLGAGGARVYIRGEEPGSAADTVMLGGLSRVRPGLPTAGGAAATVISPVRPRYRRHGRLTLVGVGLALLMVAGYLGVPPLLTALGLGPRVACRACQFPIPSSAVMGPGAGSVPAPSSAGPRPSPPARTASAPTTGPAVAVAVPPPATASPPPALEVSYTAIPAAGGFTGQVTVVNRGSATISGWRLVVALPGDTVSAVQNAEFTEDQGVVSMTPAPYDLSVAPGNDVTVSIFASGPVRTPVECTFNDVACR
jgi:Cellulose binding domain